MRRRSSRPRATRKLIGSRQTCYVVTFGDLRAHAVVRRPSGERVPIRADPSKYNLAVLRRIVYFIGAGPGAPDLITARGLRCLQAADVVIYDHLVHPRLLHHAPRDTERIDVGSAAPERMDQEAICYLIAEKAREGKLDRAPEVGRPVRVRSRRRSKRCFCTSRAFRSRSCQACRRPSARRRMRASRSPIRAAATH